MNTAQRLELNQAVVGYLNSQIGEKEASLVAKALNVDSVPPDMANRLEAKWKALVYLSHKIQTLEKQLKERPSASTNGAASPSTLKGMPSTPLLTLEEHRQPVTCVGIHSKWTVIASGCEDGTIKIWNSESGDRELTIKAHTRGVTGLDFGKVLVSCSSDLFVRIFDPQENYAPLKTLSGHEHTVSSVKLFSNDEKIASCSRDMTMRIWDTQTGYCTQVIKHHTDWVRTLSIFNGGILSAGRDLGVVISRVDGRSASNSQHHTMHGHQHVIECSATAPSQAHKHLDKIAGMENEAYFATGSRDKTIMLWSTKTLIATLTGHDNWVRGVYFEPTGRFLYSCSDDKTIRVWDLENDAKIYKVVPAHDHFVSCIMGNGKVTVTGSVDMRVRVW